MGLDDLLPDEANTRSTSSTRDQSSSSEKEYAVDVGSGRHRKAFTEEQWEKVKRVLTQEFGKKPNVVLNSPARERYEILHEAITFSEGEKEEGELENRSDTRCGVCGSACDLTAVEIGGEYFHPHHTAGQVAMELNDD